MQFSETRRPDLTPESRRAEILAAPGFGKHFTDHMVSATWTAGVGWHDAGLVPYGPIQLDPAAAVLHYAQEIFEGLKAYRAADWSFWPLGRSANGDRMNRCGRRLVLSELPVVDFLASIGRLVRTDVDWVPTAAESSLYLRPFMFASETFLGVRP